MSWPVFRVFKACLGLCFVCLMLVIAVFGCLLCLMFFSVLVGYFRPDGIAVLLRLMLFYCLCVRCMSLPLFSMRVIAYVFVRLMLFSAYVFDACVIAYVFFAFDAFHCICFLAIDAFHCKCFLALRPIVTPVQMYCMDFVMWD